MSGPILFLAHRLPYPPDRGDRIRSWHVLNALAAMAPVHVAAMIESENDRQHSATVERVAESVTIQRRSLAKGPTIARALLNGRPASVVAFENKALKASVRDLIDRREIATIYAFSGQMASYVPNDFAGRLIIDFVDVDSAKFEALGGFAHTQEARRLAHWEARAAARADVSILVSDAEEELFRGRTGIAGRVVGNGVDTDYFDPALFSNEPAGPPLIVFTGQMDYRPNVDAMIAFARDCMPALSARLAIVGRAPTTSVRRLASDRILVTGEVDDVRPWLARASVVVAPLSIARGVQNKVLEAMAMGRTVVSSPEAAQGLGPIPDDELIVTRDFTTQISELLADTQQCAAIGFKARARVLQDYRWPRRLAPLRQIIHTR